MNVAAYGSLPTSACSLGTQGANGPDRITKTSYDAAGQVLQVRRGVGTSIEIAEVTYDYTLNGGLATENAQYSTAPRVKPCVQCAGQIWHVRVCSDRVLLPVRLWLRCEGRSRSALAPRRIATLPKLPERALWAS